MLALGLRAWSLLGASLGFSSRLCGARCSLRQAWSCWVLGCWGASLATFGVRRSGDQQDLGKFVLRWQEVTRGKGGVRVRRRHKGAAAAGFEGRANSTWRLPETLRGREPAECWPYYHQVGRSLSLLCYLGTKEKPDPWEQWVSGHLGYRCDFHLHRNPMILELVFQGGHRGPEKVSPMPLLPQLVSSRAGSVDPKAC